MDNDKLAGIILGALGASAVAGISAIVWHFGINPLIKNERDLKKIMNPDSTIEYSGTIWGSWKKYGEPYGIAWDIWLHGITEYNNIKNPDNPGKYKVSILEK
ncbi:MAG: hypothetical protein ACPLXC_00045 [Candidatus Pacearchaeota archaeon]